MVRNYLGFLLSLWLMAWPAAAAELQLGDLSLRYGPPWERAPAQEEAAENSVILRWMGNGPGMTVFLPQHQVDLKVDEKRFYRQLEQSWRAQYGADARIYPLQLAGTTWRACRRPSLDGVSTVFQLVNVHQGRAHHLLVIAAGRMETLPDSAEHLAASASWGGVHSVVLTRQHREDLLLDGLKPLPPAVSVIEQPPAVVAAPAAVTAVVEPEVRKDEPGPLPEGPAAATAPAEPAASRTEASPVAEPEKGVEAPSAPAVPSQPVAEPGHRWRLARVIHVLPTGKRLTALAEEERGRFGENGMLTGYGMSLAGKGHKGFLEGYVWEEGDARQSRRKTFARQWQLAWRAPEEIGAGEQTWHLQIGEDNGAGGQALGLRLELLPLCGRRDAVLAGFDALVKSANGAGERLAALSGACQLPSGSPPFTVTNLSAPGSEEQAAILGLPAEWTLATGVRKGDVKRLVVVASHPPAQPQPQPGDALLAGVRSYFIYRP